MAVTTSSSATIRGITYSRGSSFKCYAAKSGKSDSEGNGSTSTTLTKGTTYYFYSKASGSSVKYPYSVSTNSGSSGIQGWYTEDVFPYATYSVKYNANGGSGAPGSQTKTYGTNLTLSTTKPTRTGYTFQGWGTSSSDTSVDYAAGASYTKNAAITLYAIWKANTYTITFNANGGSGGPSTATKTYGQTLTLPTTAPTRTNHTFLGWSTDKNAATATYAAGGSYTANSAATLYAVWKVNYKLPTIGNIKVERCNSDGSANDTGAYAKVTFTWSCDQDTGANNVSSITVNGVAATASEGATGTSGTVTKIVGGSYSIETTYQIPIVVIDTKKTISSGTTTKNAVLQAYSFAIDFKSGGTGVTFGGPATKDGLRTQWNLYLATDRGLSGTSADGTEYQLATLNSSNNSVFGYGGYSAGVGGSDYMGQDVRVTAKNTIALNAPGGISTSNTLHLTKNQDVSATADNDVALIIGDRSGQHIAIDSNEIICKSSGTAEGKLWIGSSLGNVAIGGVTYGQNNILATTASFMNETQTVNLSEAISAQAHGAILVWSYYSSGAYNYNWFYFFVPKVHVTNHNGTGIYFMGAYAGMKKYLYVYDTKIVGHSSNSSGAGTTNGMAFNNGYYVLRYVIGV